MEDQLAQSELDELWRFDDPMASAERFAMAAAEPRRSEVVRAELETQRARALGLQARFEEAEALLESLEPAQGRLQIRILLERGRLRNTEGRPEEAIPLFEEALALARREEETFLAVDAAHMLAIADPGRSEQWTEEAFADLAATSDHRTWRWAVVLHNNRGWALFEAREPSAALAEFERALEAAERFGTADQRFAARWSLARCLRELGQLDAATALQRRLAEERPDDPDVAAELASLTDGTPTIES
ncbi:tetratricopeptide repeat protein [Leifsonia sp. AG29]|uniref:tetratricopeptide repeat protein n=1 Tax=Leifsonia sp. AG29 TaxID=2598860 RepID=UPI00131A9117|nr:tetratricopeptide repeat protein [Leifsonia sp. AG29]